MAVLTASDYGEIRDSAYTASGAKSNFKALAAIPNETKTMQVFQAAEDRTVAAFALFRADMESALGIPQNVASLNLAVKLYASYCAWKVGSLRGG